jgi:hypothetical protein
LKLAGVRTILGPYCRDRRGLTQALGRMKIFRHLIMLSFLVPPIGLFSYAVHIGAITSVKDAFVVAIRLILVSLGAAIFAAGISEKLKFMQKDGVIPRLTFYLFYSVLFFLVSFWFGLELQFPNEPSVGRYSQ